MSINWVRLAWTLAFTILSIMVVFIYLEYSANFRERYGDLKVSELGAESKIVQPDKKGPAHHIPKKSRKYRRRR